MQPALAWDREQRQLERSGSCQIDSRLHSGHRCCRFEEKNVRSVDSTMRTEKCLTKIRTYYSNCHLASSRKRCYRLRLRKYLNSSGLALLQIRRGSKLYPVPARWGTRLQENEDSPSVVAAPVAATEAGIVADIPPITGSPVVVGCAPLPVFPPEPSVHPL